MKNWLKSKIGFNIVDVELGKGVIRRIQLFEFKKFLSCYVHIFNTIQQDRFHDHCFGALVFLLKGGYTEEVLREDGSIYTKEIKPGVRYIPRKYRHKILTSQPNTISFLICGPWDSTWQEETSTWVRTLAWGRKEIKRVYK